MKVLLFVCGFAALVGAAVASCGPQQKYCKENNDGRCTNALVDSGVQPMDVAGPGDAVIIE